MIKANNYLLGSVISVLLLSVGCSTGSVVEDADPDCDYTQNSYNHVEPRHCDPTTYPDKSKFDQSTTDYCDGISEGQNLSETVQSDYDRRTVQFDDRICYDKNMGVVVGTSGETWVRLVIDGDDGEVVTLFPESRAGCR